MIVVGGCIGYPGPSAAHVAGLDELARAQCGFVGCQSPTFFVLESFRSLD